MKIFKFFAKQGQHKKIESLLNQSGYGKDKAILKPVSGHRRGNGVMVSVILRNGVSIRTVDRMLHQEQIPGSVSRRNRFKIIKFDWVGDVIAKMGDALRCVVVRDGKMTKVSIDWEHPGCSCCSPIQFLSDKNGRRIW